MSVLCVALCSVCCLFSRGRVLRDFMGAEACWEGENAIGETRGVSMSRVMPCFYREGAVVRREELC